MNEKLLYYKGVGGWEKQKQECASHNSENARAAKYFIQQKK
jgi:hypothetical protein